MRRPRRRCSGPRWPPPAPPVDEAGVIAAIDDLWDRPEREHRYAGCLLASRFASKASPALVDGTPALSGLSRREALKNVRR